MSRSANWRAATWCGTSWSSTSSRPTPATTRRRWVRRRPRRSRMRMPEPRQRRGLRWARRGIMASDTGRVLVFGSFTLIATCFLVATALMAAVVLTALLTGWIGGDAARTLAFGVGGALATVGIALLMVPLIGRFSHLGDEVRMLEP